MKIGIIQKHREALEIITEAGKAIPKIPKGKNTKYEHFTTADGYPAIVVNQCGFTPTAEDNEEEVNGLSVWVALVEDKDSCPNAPATLERDMLDVVLGDGNNVNLVSAPAGRQHGSSQGIENDAVIRLRLPMAEKSAWVKEAQKLGLSLSSYIRKRCNF